ncbi:MAG: sugar ABC transporter permease [Lachnospiraceae bacterium]|nr:sugar ABC transporter permease [Lachnospiraceae bacterium]
MRKKKVVDENTAIKVKKKSIWKDKASWSLLLLCLPAIIGYILFNYIPIAVSITIPFRDYKFSQGILGSAFVGFKNFKWIFTSSSMLEIIRNTFLYGLWFMFLGPITNVILALLLFEVRNRKVLKIYQTVVTFPNFMSFVVVGFITYAILSPTNGFMNQVITGLGGDKIDVYINAGVWPLILSLVNIWKGIGMGSMMYFASLMGIDTSLFEAAEMDGATRWHKMRYISIPHLVPLICIYIILGVEQLVGGNFDLFYIIPRNVPLLYDTTDILSTYVYRALVNGTYAMGAAVGLLQSVVGMLLVVIANLVVKKISPDNSLF